MSLRLHDVTARDYMMSIKDGSFSFQINRQNFGGSLVGKIRPKNWFSDFSSINSVAKGLAKLLILHFVTKD